MAAARRKKQQQPACLLCGVPGLPLGIETPSGMLYEHPPNGGCAVRLFFFDGLCADDRYELKDEVVYDLDPPEAVEAPSAPPALPTGEVIYLDGGSETFTPVDEALRAIWKAHMVEFLGGTSGERGWSSISTYARCPYLWSRTVGSKGGKSSFKGLSEGSLIHAFLAVYYQKILEPGYPLEPAYLHDLLQEMRVHPEWLEEAWRVFSAYLRYYPDDVLEPLAVEHFVRDPRSGRTTRIDLIARVKEGSLLPPGTYLVDHKSSGRFDDAFLDGWRNDGTILTQLDLWHAVKLDKRFGGLRAAMANLLGKQKEPKFERVIVPAVPRVLRDHRRHLPIWIARLEHDRALGIFPRNRASCVTRFGKCVLFDHCAGDAE